MNDASRLQGRAIAGGSVLLALLFLIAILNESYWALAIPVAILVFFVLGLAGWVGYTIATIQVEPADSHEPAARAESGADSHEPAARAESGADSLEPSAPAESGTGAGAEPPRSAGGA